MTMQKLKDYLKDLFRKRPLKAEEIFREKPSFILLLVAYGSAILAIILFWKFASAVAPVITVQVTAFFKGLKAEFVDGILNKVINLVYALIIIFPVVFHLRREMTCYSLTKKEIRIVKGLLVKKTTFVPLTKVLTISVHKNLLGRVAHYGTVFIDVGGHSYPLTLEQVAYPEKIAAKILENIN